MITFAELLKRAKSERIAVHTPTEEQAKALLTELDKKGYIWSGGDKLTTITDYEVYKEDTCYAFGNDKFLLNKRVVFSSLKFHQECGYTVIEFKDINFFKKPTKTNDSIHYEQIFEAHYIAPSYLEELLKGAKEQHRNLIESSFDSNLGVAYILANGDRFVLVQITDKKNPENLQKLYVYQRKVK